MIKVNADLDVVRAVASDVRAQLERAAKLPEYIDFSMNPETLGGFCAIGSLVLNRCLRAVGIRSEIRFNLLPRGYGGHCWVALKGSPEDVAVDVTATQFTNAGIVTAPKVLICPESEFVCPCGCMGRIYQGTNKLYGVHAVRDIYNNPSWGMQSPSRHMHHIRQMIRNVATPWMSALR